MNEPTPIKTPELVPHTDPDTGEQSKQWYFSRTIILNALTLIVAVLAMPEVLNLIPNEGMRYVVAFQAIMNVALRLLTTTAVTR